MAHVATDVFAIVIGRIESVNIINDYVNSIDLSMSPGTIF